MKKFYSILLVIAAGETVFMLPFLIPRLLRPVMLEAWNLSNQDVGLAFSAYGFTAMISYFLGGPLADKFAPQKLLSLLLTALGGLGLLSAPSALVFTLSYAFFGVSTILFMWGALIKLTHLIGGEAHRSRAMGILDAGRGLTAALMSSLLVYLVTLYGANSDSLSRVYLTVSGFTALLALLVWFGVKADEKAVTEKRELWTKERAFELLKRFDIWLLSLIILAAYCGYKSVDNYALYLVKVKGLTLEESGQLTSSFFWLRPIGALVVGFLADALARFYPSSRFAVLSALLFTSALAQLALISSPEAGLSWAMALLSSGAVMAYGLRAVYFSVFGDMRIPAGLVGTAVGFVSVVGFLPDFFYGAVTGTLIDRTPGAEGFHHAFLFTAIVLLAGSLAALISYLKSARNSP